ncbi:glycosyltransferase [Aliarcobacter butzleri]|uniref:glycosyltransferase n=1 Tax=Aliarcobacter butzleri TaxID=28197 RepID=UPI002B23FD3A|nr:glycosyltransferase [Aliarcobacter butzleri]
MKKILIFIDHFLPGHRAGGPVSSIANLIKLLNNEFEIVIATRNHDFGVSEQYREVKYDEIVKYKEYKVFYMSKPNKESVSSLIEDFNPDMVFLNSLFSYFSRVVLILSMSKDFNTKVVLAPRGELQKNALAIKRFKKSVYLFLFKLFGLHKKVEFFSTDKIETDAIRYLFKKEPLVTLPNVPKVIESYNINKYPNELKILFLSRISYKKNLYFALEILKEINNKNIIFDIYGPKEDKGYWQKCESILKKIPRNLKVNYKGIVEPEEISIVMSDYQVFLFPTKSENFGHVIVEAMSVGLVSIISDQTPWVELEKYNAGWDIPLDNKNRYLEVIEKLYAMDNNEFQILSKGGSKYIRDRLAVDELREKYIQFFDKTMKG